MNYFKGIDFSKIAREKEMEMKKMEEYKKYQEVKLEKFRKIQIRKRDYNLPEYIILNSYVDLGI